VPRGMKGEGWRQVAEGSGNYMEGRMKTGGWRERELYAEKNEDRWLKGEGIICREGWRQVAEGNGNYMEGRTKTGGWKTGGWREQELYGGKNEDRWLKGARIIWREEWRQVAERSEIYMQRRMKTCGWSERELYAERDGNKGWRQR